MKVVILLAVFRVLGPHHFAEAKRVATALYDRSTDASVPIDPLLTTAIAEVESGFRATAINGDGQCVGLMQPRAGVSTKLTRRELLNPSNNVREGVRILNEKLLQCGTLPRALAAYNSGRCAPRGRATKKVRRYVHDVLNAYERLQSSTRDYVQDRGAI